MDPTNFDELTPNSKLLPNEEQPNPNENESSLSDVDDPSLPLREIEIAPSQNTEQNWLEVENETGENNIKPEDISYGMWLIFRPRDQVDRVWEIVKEATLVGELGHYSSVSTLRSTEEEGYDNHVICIFSHDANDQEDALRVRQGIQRLGILSENEDLRYKPATCPWEKRYFRNGHQNLIKWIA